MKSSSFCYFFTLKGISFLEYYLTRKANKGIFYNIQVLPKDNTMPVLNLNSNGNNIYIFCSQSILRKYLRYLVIKIIPAFKPPLHKFDQKTKTSSIKFYQNRASVELVNGTNPGIFSRNIEHNYKSMDHV